MLSSVSGRYKPAHYCAVVHSLFEVIKPHSENPRSWNKKEQSAAGYYLNKKIFPSKRDRKLYRYYIHRTTA
jgi:hypothetical protein